MPFDAELLDVYNIGIKSTLEKMAISAERVDEQVFHREGILQRIYDQIETADIIIADMTGRNPNVFYEVGYAHAKGKLCVLLTKNANDIPFDLKHHRHIVYSSIGDLQRKLSHDISHIRPTLVRTPNPFVVSVHSSFGELKKSSISADAVARIRLDIHNLTPTTSPEIDAIYLYTSGGWLFSQDNQDCASSDSDLEPYKRRHFLKSPVQRLSSQGWAPLVVTGSKLVWGSWRKEELREQYELTGTVLVRVRTSKGDFDSQIQVTVRTDDIPF